MRSSLLAPAILLACATTLVALAEDHDDDAECKRLCDEAKALLLNREFEKSLAIYEKARAVDPKSPGAQFMIGVAYSMLKRWDEAIAEQEKVPALDSPRGHLTARSLEQRAYCYCMKGEYEKSVDNSRACLKIEADNWAALTDLAGALGKLGQYEEAIAAAERSIKLQPDQPDMGPWLEQTRAKAKDPKRKIYETSFALPPIGGWLTTPDLRTLVVSVPSRAELLVFDTTTKDEPKHLPLDFQPGRLALQGKHIYATVHGGARLHAIDLETGKVQKTFKLPGDGVLEIACHPSKGLVYAATKTGDVVAIDSSSGRIATTKAKGALLAVDPSKGAYVYAAGSGAKDADATALRKYAVQGLELKLLDTNPSAAIRGCSLRLSPDGKRVAVVGEGYRGPKEEPDPNKIAVFETDSINTAAGQIDAGGRPAALAYHPFLDLCLVRCDRSLVQLRARSLTRSETWSLPPLLGPGGELAFGAGGTTVVSWLPGDPAKTGDGTLAYMPLKLSPEETAALEKAAGKPR